MKCVFHLFVCGLMASVVSELSVPLPDGTRDPQPIKKVCMKRKILLDFDHVRQV